MNLGFEAKSMLCLNSVLGFDPKKISRFESKLLIQKRLIASYQVRMEFNFEAILKAVEKTVARVFGKWIILVNISGKVSNQHSV